MKPKDLPLFQDRDVRKVIDDACRKHGITIGLLRDLLNVQRKYTGAGRQMGITADFDACFAEFLEEHDQS